MSPVVVLGLDIIDIKLGQIAQALDQEEVLDEAEAVLLNRIRARFLAEEGPDGPWIKSEASLKRRAKGGTGTLFDTGTLFHSIQAFASGPGERAIATDVPYAKYHQFGLGQEKRVFLGFNADDAFVVERLIIHRLEEAVQ